MVNYTPLWSLILLVLMSFNLGVFFEFEVSKRPYIPLIILIVWFLFLNFKKLKFLKSPSTYFLCFFFFFNLFRSSVPLFWTHIFFIFILITLIFFLRLSIKGYYELSRLSKYIRLTLNISLIFAIIDTIVKINQPGWVWPINIALQEILLVGMLYSCLITGGGVRNNYLSLFLFILLLMLRESGKAAVFGILLALFLIYFSKNHFKTIKRLKKLCWIVFIGQYLFIILAVFGSAYLRTSNNSSLEYVFNKRFGLVLDGYNFITSDLQTFFFGGGFGAENYILQNPDLVIPNAPQLFILTTSVYGGVIFCLILIISILRLPVILKLENKFSPVPFMYLQGFFLSLLIISSFHEYFNNPFVYISIALVVTSYNSILKVSNY